MTDDFEATLHYPGAVNGTGGILPYPVGPGDNDSGVEMPISASSRGRATSPTIEVQNGYCHVI